MLNIFEDLLGDDLEYDIHAKIPNFTPSRDAGFPGKFHTSGYTPTDFTAQELHPVVFGNQLYQAVREVDSMYSPCAGISVEMGALENTFSFLSVTEEAGWNAAVRVTRQTPAPQVARCEANVAFANRLLGKMRLLVGYIRVMHLRRLAKLVQPQLTFDTDTEDVVNSDTDAFLSHLYDMVAYAEDCDLGFCESIENMRELALATFEENLDEESRQFRELENGENFGDEYLGEDLLEDYIEDIDDNFEEINFDADIFDLHM